MKKRYLIYALVAVIAYVGLVLLYRLFEGSVTIDTTSDTAQLYTYESGKKVIIGTGKATVRGPGNHTVFAQDGEALTVAAYRVERWKNQDVNMRIFDPLAPEVFSQELARSLVVKGSSVRFLQPETYEVLETRLNERAVLVSGFDRARSVYWADYDTAVYSNLSNEYFVYDKGKSERLIVPGGSGQDNPAITSLDISQSGELAIIADGSLYYYGSVSATPKRLANDVQQDAALNVNNNLLAYAEKVDAGDDTFSGEGTLVDNQPIVNVYDARDGSTAKSLPVPANGFGVTSLVLSVELSPDSSALLLTTVDGIFYRDLSADSFSSLAFEPSQLPLAAVWFDDDRVLYTTEQGVWLSDIVNHEAYLIGVAEGIQLSSSLYVDNSFIWFGDNVSGRFGTGNIKRFPLDGLD